MTNTPGVLTEDTADMTMALILAVSRRLVEGERWPARRMVGLEPTSMLGHRITGKRLGILGMGRIGSAVARRARGFRLAIHYHNRRRGAEALETELEATYWESLDQMLARMDHQRQLSARRPPSICSRPAGSRSCGPLRSSSTPRAAR